MLLLFNKFAFIVVDLVPEDADEWSLYLLRGITALVLQKKVHRVGHASPPLGYDCPTSHRISTCL